MGIEQINSIFPRPKKCVVKNGFVTIGTTGQSNCCLLADINASALEKESVNLVIQKICEKIGAITEVLFAEKSKLDDVIVIKVKTLKNSDIHMSLPTINSEGYFIEVNENEIILCGIEDKGAYYAAQTFVQLMQMEGDRLTLPLIKIDDWPDMKYRGLFLEDRYGTDRMTLQDWKNAIDYMASLKMNFMTIGVYGCWVIQYDNHISEYLYLPIDKYPDLKTLKTIRYYSPLKRKWEIADTFPEMFEKDFFSELITYGKKKNIIVRPHFNSMGHNTLIPRMFPEISAKDAEGHPTGYCLCTSNSKTYEVLFNIYDEIIDKYLKSNGIDWFHMGLDEVMKSVGIDIEEPSKEVDPWCHCELCSQHSHEELFTEHVIRLAKHLKSKGMNNISMWHDQLSNMNLINEDLVTRLKQEGLYGNFILNWWDYTAYNGFKTTLPELKLRRFITPMTGYFHWILTDSCLINIYNMLNLAHKEGIEGAEAYSAMDYSYDRNYNCFSEYSWNAENLGDLAAFKKSYIEKRFYGEVEKAKNAFEYYDRLIEPGEKFDVMSWLLSYYIYTYVQRGKDYPRNFPGEAFSKISEDSEKYKTLLTEVYEDSSKAYELFSELSEMNRFDQNLLEHYKCECLNYKVLSNEYLKLIELNDSCFDYRLSKNNTEDITALINKVSNDIHDLKRNREKLMLDIEKCKESYLVPSELRNYSIHRQYLADLETYFDKMAESIKNGDVATFPLLNLKDSHNIESRIFKLLR